MSGIDPDWRRKLGRHVRRRRLERGLSVSAAARRADRMDRATWTGIENGDRETEDYNLARVEPVLLWERGSIDSIQGGGDPIELPLPDARRPPSIEDIPPELRAQPDPAKVIRWVQDQPWEEAAKLEVLEQLYEPPPGEERSARAS